MRLVAVADTHLFHEDLDVPDGDLFVHAGDLCRHGSLDELEVAAELIRSLPHSHKVVVAGNHDWSFVHHPEESRRILGDGVIYLEGVAATIAGLRFWGGPWQPEYNDWAFNLPPGAALAEKWAHIPAGLDVLVTHGPPMGIGDGGSYGAGRLGDDALRDRVRAVRPRLHLFGHIHDSGGAWQIDGTLFVNCTTWECSRAATVIEIDEKSVRISE